MTTECPCPKGEQPLGRLYGISMGRGVVRLTTTSDCPIHNEHTYIDSGKTPEHGEPCSLCRTYEETPDHQYCKCPCHGQCARCKASRLAWIHPEFRPPPAGLRLVREVTG
jgi:hypothetical protein